MAFLWLAKRHKSITAAPDLAMMCPSKSQSMRVAQEIGNLITKGTNLFCVTRLQLLVFWTKFFGAHIPLLAEEGSPRHPKNGSVPICRGRGGQFGAPSKGQPN